MTVCLQMGAGQYSALRSPPVVPSARVVPALWHGVLHRRLCVRLEVPPGIGERTPDRREGRSGSPDHRHGCGGTGGGTGAVHVLELPHFDFSIHVKRNVMSQEKVKMPPHLAQLDVLGPGWFHPPQAGL